MTETQKDTSPIIYLWRRKKCILRRTAREIRRPYTFALQPQVDRVAADVEQFTSLCHPVRSWS